MAAAQKKAMAAAQKSEGRAGRKTSPYMPCKSHARPAGISPPRGKHRPAHRLHLQTFSD
jgi:hypothetical protein